MNKGVEKLFNNLFNTPPESPTARESKKGRSSQLDYLRNSLLVERYYYYSQFTDKRYSAILNILHYEFFLSESRIVVILDTNISVLENLKKQDPPKELFKRKWPHLNWSF